MTKEEAKQLDYLLEQLAREGRTATEVLQSVKMISYENLCEAIAQLEELF